MTLYAIGDIHGQRAALEDALARVDADGVSGARVVFMGDYTDRGPDSRGVLDLLCGGIAAGRDWVLLKGNHDRMFSWFMEEVPRHDPHLLVQYYWLHEKLGGDTTLASYGVDASPRRRLADVHADAMEAVPEGHLDLLDTLSLSHKEDGMFFAHAGVRPGVPLSAQEEEDLLWIRQEFLTHTAPFEQLVVHGHTPVETPEHAGNRVNTDGGAGYGRPLTPLAFEDGAVFALSPKGRVRLIPPGSRA